MGLVRDILCQPLIFTHAFGTVLFSSLPVLNFFSNEYKKDGKPNSVLFPFISKAPQSYLR